MVNLNSPIANLENCFTNCLIIKPVNVNESDHVELFGITIDKHLHFKNNIDNLWLNTNYKLHALKRMRKYLAVEKAKLLANAFIHFHAVLLMWMFCQQILYLNIEKIPHKTLRTIHQSNASYCDLLISYGGASS